MQTFHNGRRTLACGALFMAAVAARAEEAPRELAPVQVSGEAAGSDLTDLAEPAAQLQGRELARDRAMSLGDTVAKLPGAASSGYGPNAGRPVLRGLDGERVRILNDGAASLDASSMSADHAVAIDPLSAARIELLRGPAALLYGGSAVGGIVNVSDGRIPSDAPRNTSGRLGLSYGSAARETAGSAEVETGNGSWALHADAYSRRSEDLDIAGAAVSPRLRALAAAGRASVSAQSLAADGRLPGSAANAEGAGFGAAYNTGRGYAGFAYSQQDANYGTVAEPGVSIAMRRERWDLAGEISGLAGFVQALRYKFGHTDYQHVELDAGTPATRFLNRGDTGRVEFDHAPLAGFNGIAGLEFGRSNFSALGEEAFLPRSRSASYALFVLEQAKWRGATLSFAARGESAQLDSAGGGPDDPDAAPGTPRFGAARRRDFTPASFAAALEFGPAAARFGLVLSHNERAPSYAELYANGPHAATGTYEVGNPDLPKERSNALEATLRLQSGPYGLKLAAWQNRYRNYLGQIPTGVRRDADGRSSRNGPLTDCGDGTSAESGCSAAILPEFALVALPARYTGFEAEGRRRMLDAPGKLDLVLRIEALRATNLEDGSPMPRIAPLVAQVALDYRAAVWGARMEVKRAAAQNRVAANELPTDGYTLTNFSLDYRLRGGPSTWDVWFKAENLFNQQARNHVSVLKDIAPEPGRNLALGLRAAF